MKFYASYVSRLPITAVVAFGLLTWVALSPVVAAEQGSASQSAPLPGSLDELKIESQETARALFSTADQVIVKPPVLQALITLNSNLNPYGLDAQTSRVVGLPDTLQEGMKQNLDIQISAADFRSSHWQYISKLGGFLPDVVNAFSYQQLDGKFASPFGLLARIDSPYITAPTGLQWYFFKGGSIIYGARQAYHTQQAQRFGLQGTTNDTLLSLTNAYYNLVLNDILLEIRTKAVQTSRALLLRNQIQFENGAVTKLEVLEAKAQLSKDRQALVAQQIARRQAAIQLARIMNDNSGVDLCVADRVITKKRLVNDSCQIGELLQVAIDNRPELKQYEQLRRAAKDAVKVAFAPLLPQVYGTVGGIATAARVSPSSSSSAASSAAAGGLVTGGEFAASSTAPASSGASKSKKFTGAELFQVGMSIQWNIGGLGLTDSAQVQSARWQARKAQLQFNQKLAEIYQEVRDAYLDSLNAEQQIEETTDAVNANSERLYVATTRLEESVGTDLEVLIAQRDFTDSLINKASAIINFNLAQAKLLRAMGRISIPTLTAAQPLAR